MSIEERVESAIKGDKEAFCELVESRKKILYRTAYMYVKSEDEALDIVNETVYKAYISINKLKNPQYFNTWLTRILINSSIDRIKKNKRILPLEDYGLAAKEHKSDEYIDLYDAIDKLKDNYKTVVILKYFRDMTLEEISEVLQCPVNTVKTYLHRAKKELRINLVEESEGNV